MPNQRFLLIPMIGSFPNIKPSISWSSWAVAEAEIVREQWPELHVEVIENTSHVLFVDESERFNGVLEEFLATLPEQ